MDLICLDSKVHLKLLQTYYRSCPVWCLALFLIVGFLLLAFVQHYMTYSFESKRFPLSESHTALNVQK